MNRYQTYDNGGTGDSKERATTQVSGSGFYGDWQFYFGDRSQKNQLGSIIETTIEETSQCAMLLMPSA
jgi:hypothetical protein